MCLGFRVLSYFGHKTHQPSPLRLGLGVSERLTLVLAGLEFV